MGPEPSISIISTRPLALIGNPHFGKSYAVNLNQAHDQLQELIERVTMELELMNVAKELEG